MTAAITRVKDDLVKLEAWLSYYSKYFDDLYVYGCLCTPDIEKELKNGYKGYEFDFIPVEEDIHGLGMLENVREKQVKLLKDHKWVLYTDMDEFVIPDPNKYLNLKDFMVKAKDKQTFCEGYWVYQSEGEAPMDWSKPFLSQRKYWWRDTQGSYNKPALSQVETKWVYGFHQIEGVSPDDVKAIQNTGLYLIHFKFVDFDNSAETRQDTQSVRKEIPGNIRRML